MNLKPFPDRWWYAPPWKRTRPWRFVAKIYIGGDEYCNDTVVLGLPLCGDITIRFRKKIRRYGACDKCIADFGPFCDGCETCHEGPRCHRWIECEHTALLLNCPACKGWYCQDCEPDPSLSCSIP